MSHVLHVDDDSSMRELTETFLKRQNQQMTVSPCSSGQAALAEINGHVDCIVSDYDMPGMNGLELLEAVRQTHPDLPFILFTGKGSEEVASDAITKGVTDYLQKGGGSDQYTVLNNRINNSIALYRAKQEVQRGYAAIEAASDGIALLDTKGDFIYVNEAYASLYGYEQEELADGRWEQLHSDEEVARFYEEILSQVNSNGSWNGLSTGKQKAGNTLVIDHSITLTADDTTICIVRDIKDKGDRERVLSTELNFLDDALDALDDIFYLFDMDGRLIWWNQRMNEVTGYSDKELQTMEPVEFVRPQDQDTLEPYITTILEEGIGKVEVELLTADEKTIPYEFYSTKLRGRADEAVGRVGIGRDITTRKGLQWELEEKNQRFDEFANVLSHDLRNPLTIATGHVELIAEHIDDEGVGSLDAIETALSRIETIISDILQMSRTGQPVTDPQPVELSTIARPTWQNIEHGLIQLAIEEPVTVRADESLLSRLLMNLFRNSVEHGGEDVQVTVGPLANACGFYVEDDGPGIPPDDRERVFDWKYTTKETGHGIGLKSIERICNAHGWTITIGDGERGGARFEIETGTLEEDPE